MLDDIIKSNSNLDLSSNNDQDHLNNIINDLKKIKDEGKVLFKQNNIEEAKNIFLKGYNLLQGELSKLYIDYSHEEKIKEIFGLYRKILSKIALCFYNQGKVEDAIIYDLKTIELEPKNGKSLIRLFNSYSKLNKCRQAVFYGELFLDLDDKILNKYASEKVKIHAEKVKLSKIQKKTYRENVIIFFGSVLIIILAILLFYKKNNNNISLA